MADESEGLVSIVDDTEIAVEATGEIMTGFDAFATIPLQGWEWYVKLYSLSESSARLTAADVRACCQTLRPMPNAETRVWPPLRERAAGRGGGRGGRGGRGGGRRPPAGPGRGRRGRGGRGAAAENSGSDDSDDSAGGGAGLEEAVPVGILADDEGAGDRLAEEADDSPFDLPREFAECEFEDCRAGNYMQRSGLFPAAPDCTPAKSHDQAVSFMFQIVRIKNLRLCKDMCVCVSQDIPDRTKSLHS